MKIKGNFIIIVKYRCTRHVTKNLFATKKLEKIFLKKPIEELIQIMRKYFGNYSNFEENKSAEMKIEIKMKNFL